MQGVLFPSSEQESPNTKLVSVQATETSLWRRCLQIPSAPADSSVGKGDEIPKRELRPARDFGYRLCRDGVAASRRLHLSVDSDANYVTRAHMLFKYPVSGQCATTGSGLVQRHWCEGFAACGVGVACLSAS